MTPEERRQFEEMQRTIEELTKQVRANDIYKNTQSIDTITNKQIVKVDSFDTTNLTGTENTNKLLRDYTIPAGGSTITTLDTPTHLLSLRYKGKIYRIAGYEFI